MLTRRTVLVIIGLGLLANPLRAVTQQRSRVFRIGYLVPGSASAYASRLEAFKQGLGKLGYTEGKNFVIEYRWADGKYERLPDLAAELVRLKLDLIVTQTTPPTQAAQQATSTIPIVMVSVGNPVEIGLVASLARPGGNTTGVANFVGDTSAKQLDLLAATVPKLSRVAVLMNPANPSSKVIVKDVQTVAQAIGVRIILTQAQTPAEIEQAFSVMTKDRAQALLLLGDGYFFQQRVQITELAAKARLPAIYNIREYAEVGGLMSYGANALEITRRAAAYADRILKGAKPADIPVERPNTLELVINRKTEKALGIRFPGEMLLRADKIIE